MPLGCDAQSDLILNFLQLFGVGPTLCAVLDMQFTGRRPMPPLEFYRSDVAFNFLPATLLLPRSLKKAKSDPPA